jgi:hypothetical protein
MSSGKVHALVRLELAAVVHHRSHSGSVRPGDLRGHDAVVQQDAGAGAHVSRERIVRGGDLAQLGLALRREDHLLASFQVKGRVQVSDPDAGALQIDEHRRRVPPSFHHAAQVMNPARANLGRTVRRVDADDVDACVEQRRHLLRLLPGGAQRGHDFGATNRGLRHAWSLTSHRHRRMTTCPPTTVSAAWPARKA